MMTKLAAASHRKTIGGRNYAFRPPTLYDLPKMRWRLTRAAVRKPSIDEYRLASLAGIEAMGRIADDGESAIAQRDVIERWYELIKPLTEDDIDEVDEDLRKAELARREADRQAERVAMFSALIAIEANLDRHWSDWRELRADAALWDEISAIDATRLLLVSIDGSDCARVTEGDDDGLVTEAAYGAIPVKDRLELGSFALSLLTPTETERKN